MRLAFLTAVLIDSPPRSRDAHWAELLRTNGLRAVLALLNSRTRHRYTGVYAFVPPMLRNLCLYDRENPELVCDGGDTPMDETYCSIVGTDGNLFATPDARLERRLSNHPARSNVIAYCGVPLRAADGSCFGTLCHFDLRPRLVPNVEVPVLYEVALIIAPLALTLRDGSHSKLASRA